MGLSGRSILLRKKQLSSGIGVMAKAEIPISLRIAVALFQDIQQNQRKLASIKLSANTTKAQTALAKIKQLSQKITAKMDSLGFPTK
jgi:hypothetical protein